MRSLRLCSMQLHNYEQNFQVVERSSATYRHFIEKIEDNYKNTSSRLGACLSCWAFISPCQRRRHEEHEPYIVTASFFKNEEAFLKLARDQNKISGGVSRVILFKD